MIEAVWYLPFALALVTASALGVALGYHRFLTHRACKLHPLVEKLVVTAGIPAGTPVQWIGNHRFHHSVADTEADAHSPVTHGFWTAHAGWYLETEKTWPAVLYSVAGPLRMLFDAFWRPRTNQQHVGLAKDVAADPYYAFLSTRFGYALVLLSYLAALYLASWILFGPLSLLWTSALHVFAYAVGDLINSVGHGKLGSARFASGDQSRNVWLLGLVAFGDGFHNGHHAFPSSIRCGHGWTEPDGVYLAVRGLELLGLASDLKLPSAHAVQRRALRGLSPRKDPC